MSQRGDNVATIGDVRLEARPYQQDAVSWALARQQAVCCLPTGTGKTLVGLLWVRALQERGLARRVLVLEPTRLLVSQTTEYYLDKAGAEGIPIDGRIPPEQRRLLWQGPLVVATPETAYNDRDCLNFDAVVVDECHHTVGQDAFTKLLSTYSFPFRLGLSATVPERRRREVEALIGLVRQWSWTDQEIRPYVPDWIGEVYESALGVQEAEVLRTMRQLATAPGLNPGLLERYLARDGTPALVETLKKLHSNLARAYGPQLLSMLQGAEDSLHKWPAVEEVLEGHDFRKAIIFVERTHIARLLAARLQHHSPVLLMGKANAGADQTQALQQARREDCRVVISTSAGEEGVDLPSADLLIVWGNVASEVRFIQRQGRIMRRTGDRLKFAIFVVTPETVDYDSFVRGLEAAVESKALDVEKTFGWDPEVLWPRTTWWHVSESLRGRPRPLSEMEQALQVRGSVADRVINHAVKRGRLFYVYDVARIVQDAMALGEGWYQEWCESMFEGAEGGARDPQAPRDQADGAAQALEWHRRVGWSIGTSWGGRMREYRVYALSDDVAGLWRARPDLFSSRPIQLLGELILAGKTGKRARPFEAVLAARGGRESVFQFGQWFSYTPGDDPSLYIAELRTREDVLGLVFRRRKSERLEYWCKPESTEVLEALAQNSVRFLELLDDGRGT